MESLAYEDDDCDEIYQTSGNIVRIGRSLSIDLLDAKVRNCQVNDPHVTILFRQNPAWTDKELEFVQQKRVEYLTQHNISCIQFTTQGWGPNSMLIIGDEFNDYARFLMSSYTQWQQDRPLHVTIRHRK
jgi:hypothetical protein